MNPNQRSTHLHRHPMLNGQAKPDVNDLPTWAQRAWKQLRSAFLIGAFAAGLVLGGLKLWREAFPPAEPATVQDVTNTVDGMRDEMATVAQEAVREALATYTDSLRTVQRNIEDSVLGPIYRSILDLNKRLGSVERNQVKAGIAIEEQRRSSDAATDRILQRMEESQADELVIEAMDKVFERLDEIEKQVQMKGKTTKQRF